jgi:hypothetical protein
VAKKGRRIDREKGRERRKKEGDLFCFIINFLKIIMHCQFQFFKRETYEL